MEARRALLARCRALFSERDPDQAFGEAIQLAAALLAFQRARTGPLYGEWLRRERRTDARAHLRKVFTKLGTAARADLIRAGLSPREPT